MHFPIRNLIDYAKSEPFDRIIFDHTRHHARWFFQAGLKNLHWIPALDFTFQQRQISARPSRQLTFVGQAGRFHPHRCHVLEELKRAGLPLEVMQTTPGGAADVYADSLITLNIALNGDLNLRVFEALSAGGFLMTDRLTQSSGLAGLFIPGEHLETWTGTGELIEKIRFYLANPAEAFRIRRAGQKKLMELHSPEVKIREFWDLVLHGKENPAYTLEEERGALCQISAGPAIALLPAYEIFQELHRNRSRLVFYCAEVDREWVRRFVDLPRVECRVHGEWGEDTGADGEFPEERILHIGETLDAAVLESLFAKSQPQHLFAPAADPEALATWGYTRKEAGVYELGRPVRGIVRSTRARSVEEAREKLPPCVDLCINDIEALEVADACDAAGLADARKEALLRAVFLNRDCVPALVQLADLSLEAGALVDAALLLSEANRVEPLPSELAPVFAELTERVSDAPAWGEYKRALAGGEHPEPKAPRRILVVTNLFPPQELGGYGRKLWEFSAGLVARGHEVLILTSDSPYLAKEADESEMALEGRVRRVMRLFGEWRGGKTSLVGGPADHAKVIQENASTVLKTVREFSPDFVLLGNLDYMGVMLAQRVVASGIPVVHSLGNETPGYAQQDCFKSPLYTLAPASDWLGRNLLKLGYSAPAMETVYPGARIDCFYRYLLPDCRRLRIAYASLMMPYKGPQLLVQALIQLHQSGVDFEAEIAGDSTDQAFVDSLERAVAEFGLSNKVRFIGYQGRKGLASLFARSNVLVFPSQFDEPFGITQVEAMAAGLIVVTSGRGGSREIVEHGRNGLIFEAGNAGSLAQNLLNIAIDRDLRLKLQKNARDRAIELSVTASVVRLENLAEAMLAKLGGGSRKNLAEPVDSDLSSKGVEEKKDVGAAHRAFYEGRLAEAEDVCRELLQADEKCAGAWGMLARLAFLNGDLETAQDFATVASDLEPEDAGFARMLAEVLLQRGELDQAEERVRRVLEGNEDDVEGLVLLGRLLAERGEQGDALNAFERALRLRKDDTEALSHYATALQKFDRGKDAVSQMRKAVALAPDSVEAQTKLAMLLEKNARYVDALAAYGKASRLNPDVGFVWFRQGKLLNGLKRYVEAVGSFERVLALPGASGEAHYEYGLALHMTKRLEEALKNYDLAVAAGYNSASLQCNRGVIFKEFRKGGDSILAFHAAVKMDPSNISYLNNLGAAALEMGLNSEALDCFEEAVRQNPKIATAQNNIGNLLKDRARGHDALPHYQKAMELAPEDRDSPSNFLLCHMYLADVDPKLVFEEHRKWGVNTAKKFPSAFKFKLRERGTKLRVGFLSADLCHHPVAHFIEPIFRHYDRSKFDFLAYGDQRKSDEFSQRFSKMVDVWTETCTLDDKPLAKKIHDDRVDILFELAGHTAYNRLGVFALKPAPVQVTYLGYPGTTGLQTIDFRLTDVHADPPGMTEKFYTERLIRMPSCAWCYEPDEISPEPGAAPFQRNGFVTFGCFNNMAKLNPALFDMWVEILKGAPRAHLRLKARTLTDNGVRDELKNYFTSRGIEAERLDFFGHTQKTLQHLAHYQEVDIALDSFPYHGTTTTCEAMWMGVPVVSRAGQTHVSRVGVSLLHAVGLEELVADSREAYIAKAVELAGDPQRLVELRPTMRDRIKGSLLMDGEKFARDFAAALEEMALKL
jgi:predicted O-linked N-acetylglucosamine transferase (SPINDLY family)/glycosyltransferase involved in cell wall biosynthesis